MRPLRRILVFSLILSTFACSDPMDPWIEAIAPSSGASGDVVDVVGERFGGVDRGITFGGVNAEILFWGARRARVRIPEGRPGLTIVVVMIDGRPSNAVDFTVSSASPGP